MAPRVLLARRKQKKRDNVADGSRTRPPHIAGSEKITYTPQNVLVTLCNKGADKYEFGFNTQMKSNEVAGIGNWNTAEFWEYNTRTARRANLDPVDQINISNYSVFGNNPIVNVDIKGDIVDPWYKKSTQLEYIIPGNGGLRSQYKSFRNQEILTNFSNSMLHLTSSNKIFAHVYFQLSTSKKHYRVQQFYEYSINAAAQYIPSDKTIKLFYFGASKEAIFEEFFHAGQDEYYSNNGIKRSNLADEVEAKVANLISGYKDVSADNHNYSSITNYFKTGNKDKNYNIQVGQLIDEVYDSFSKANGKDWSSNNQKSSIDLNNIFQYLKSIVKPNDSSKDKKSHKPKGGGHCPRF